MAATAHGHHSGTRNISSSVARPCVARIYMSCLGIQTCISGQSCDCCTPPCTYIQCKQYYRCITSHLYNCQSLPPGPLQVSNFPSVPTITSLTGNVGSLGGGLPLTLTVGGAGLPSGSNATSIAVTVAGLACQITDRPTATTVTCLAPAVTPGTALAEYWNVGFPSTPLGVPFDVQFGRPAGGCRRRGGGRGGGLQHRWGTQCGARPAFHSSILPQAISCGHLKQE